MPNLRSSPDGFIWCPKVNKDIHVNSLAGCAHCPFRVSISQDQNKSYRVNCSAAPKNKFCKRIHFDADGNMFCLRDATLEQYQVATGDLQATQVPDGFRIPEATTFTDCWMCASLHREPSEPVEAEIKEVIKYLKGTTLKSVVPSSEGARAARAALLELNPEWKSRYEELEQIDGDVTDG